MLHSTASCCFIDILTKSDLRTFQDFPREIQRLFKHFPGLEYVAKKSKTFKQFQGAEGTLPVISIADSQIKISEF